MNCIQTRALFSDFYDNRLSQKARKPLEAHLSGCLKCQDEYARFIRILVILKKLKAHDAPRDYTKGLKSPK